MVAAERGADFVGLAAEAEVIGWWAELMEVPSVVFDAAAATDCTNLANAGADFVALGEALWDHPAGSVEAIATFSDAVAMAA